MMPAKTPACSCQILVQTAVAFCFSGLFQRGSCLCQGILREGWKLLTPRLVSNSYWSILPLLHTTPDENGLFFNPHTHR